MFVDCCRYSLQRKWIQSFQIRPEALCSPRLDKYPCDMNEYTEIRLFPMLMHISPSSCHIIAGCIWELRLPGFIAASQNGRLGLQFLSASQTRSHDPVTCFSSSHYIDLFCLSHWLVFLFNLGIHYPQNSWEIPNSKMGKVEQNARSVQTSQYRT